MQRSSDLSIRRTHSPAMILVITFALGAVAAFGAFMIASRAALPAACVQRMEPISYRRHAAGPVRPSPSYPAPHEFVSSSIEEFDR